MVTGVSAAVRVLALAAPLAMASCAELGTGPWPFAPEDPDPVTVPAVVDDGRLVVRAEPIALLVPALEEEASDETGTGEDDGTAPGRATDEPAVDTPVETTASEDDAEPADREDPVIAWTVAPAEHASLRAAIADWAERADWRLEWRAEGLDYRPSARAVYEGDFLSAVEAVLSSAELGGRLRAEAYSANRWLVVREAGR